MSSPRPFRKASIALASCYTRVETAIEVEGVRKRTLFFVLFLLSLSRARQSSTKAPWDSLKFFVGNWQGTFQGEPGHGTGEQHYQKAEAEWKEGGAFLVCEEAEVADAHEAAWQLVEQEAEQELLDS